MTSSNVVLLLYCTRVALRSQVFIPLGIFFHCTVYTILQDRLLCSIQRVKVVLRLNKSLRNNLFHFYHLNSEASAQDS